VWSVVRVPTLEEEDRRQLPRELMTLKQNRTRVTNRIKGLLAGQGLSMSVDADFRACLAYLHRWDGGALPPGLRQRLEREYAQVALYTERIRQIEKERHRLLSTGLDAGSRQARQLYSLRGIGENGAWTLAMELFSWRRFRNRRELGAITGLVPTPYQSGETSREQGIAKSGNRRVRALAVELAWGWLRYQPESQLTIWYEERFAHGSRRMRKVGIVALARRLLIELWRYLETGVLPEGAELKPATSARYSIAPDPLADRPT
jgi:transposase